MSPDTTVQAPTATLPRNGAAPQRDQPLVALVGNPNAGKSTLFNAFTGARQHVGNWPGKTVDVKTGTVRWDGRPVTLVDLPGAYSLSAHSLEEVIARDFILEERPDVAIVVVDATNLERNLYLVVQVMELGVPVAIALNMMDQAEAEGTVIDVARLSQLLGVPVVPTVGTRRQGLADLLHKALTEARPQPRPVDYGLEAERELARLEPQVAALAPLGSPRHLALKLLEGDKEAMRALGDSSAADALRREAAAAAERIRSVYGDDAVLLIADRRYGYVHGLAHQVVRRSRGQQRSLTDRIDDVVASRLLGLPIFFGLMALVFKLTADASAPFVDWVDVLFNDVLARWAAAGLTGLAAPSWIISLAVDGVLAGVGGVLTFLPVLLVLYFCLAVLEDSGYMARAAFVMDRAMHALGLHGKSFIPLIVGFGCNVPGILATRTLEHRRDRILTGLLVPLMSCAARLPVYVIFAAAFFPRHTTAVIFSLYLLGIALAVVSGLVFQRTLFAHQRESLFVLELPPYRLPTLRGLLTHMWRHSQEFVVKAGTVILAASIIVWALLNLPVGARPEESLFGRGAGAVAPAFEPLGFGNWEATGALTTGLVAKEVVVSTMSVIYVGGERAGEPEPVDIAGDVRRVVLGLGQATLDAAKVVLSLFPGVNLLGDQPVEADTALGQALQRHFTPLSAAAFLVFVLLYAPCVATLAALRAEFGGRWAAFSFFYLLALAWLAGFVTYQVGGWLVGG
ncbi:MAG: ferrous iron transport protein B [Caldilineales bacterium]|nr:ferrous iron transport protein B [Caldilineales bacterium]MDW8316328.1 ferrous iron transport protein B [Anaerolineae bacterium]